MNFFGIGGLELALILLVGLFVLGPVRLVQGARTARKYMTELRRQREELTQMVEEAVDMQDVQNRLDEEGVLDAVRDLSSELNNFKEDAASVGRDLDEITRSATSVMRPQGYRSGTFEKSNDLEDSKESDGGDQVVEVDSKESKSQ